MTDNYWEVIDNFVEVTDIFWEMIDNFPEVIDNCWTHHIGCKLSE